MTQFFRKLWQEKWNLKYLPTYLILILAFEGLLSGNGPLIERIEDELNAIVPLTLVVVFVILFWTKVSNSIVKKWRANGESQRRDEPTEGRSFCWPFWSQR